MFGLLKKKAEDATKKFSGRTDFLQAVTALCALVAYADGSATDDEINATKKAVKANASLAASFDARTVEKTLDGMLERASSGRSGRAGLWKEVDDIAHDAEQAEAAILAALDVAESDGDLGAEERAVLEKAARTTGVNFAALLEV